ncbi:MAG TPA: electron transfer flavoprotein subunit beta/FixA family protein [bacterium]|nr:electron transfer flavoprotein subunit beta/FixA family protein [bacterium]HPN42191.1 electron transfer flavoprotein subunit beta/FixA family protein [bacterium]
MKIIVCVKQVPDTEANIKIGADNKSIVEAGIKFIINPFDEFAIEEAIKIKEAGKAESVIAIGWGPERSQEVLRTAVAMGVDDVVLLKTDAVSIDSYTAAKILAAKIKTMSYDLILTGKETIDDGNMQIGPMLGELLNIPCVTLVTKLDVDGANLSAKREIEGGYEVVETACPAIVTCQKGLNEPRYPSIRGVMLAKKKVVAVEPAAAEADQITVTTMAYPAARSGGKVVGQGAEAVPALVKLLHEEARVL